MEPVVIGAIIGAIGSAVAMIIKAAFSRNQNKKDQYEHEENLIKLASVMGDVDKTVTRFKEEISERLQTIDDKISSFQKEQERTNIATLRHSITSTYESFKDKEEIPNIVYESTMSLYDCYKRQGGNSYVDEEIEKMKGWKKF